ncbi:hypothetical protein K3495_g16021, partial [Podosphaera aphanis]
MRPRAKTGFLVGYNSRNIYRILLLDEEIVIGTRDVTFDETRFVSDHDELTTENYSIPVIDFTMTTLIPDITFDIEDFPIRNNEPNSQTNDDSNDAERSSIPENTSKSDSHVCPISSDRSTPSPQVELDGINKRIHPKVDRCAIDESNIIVGQRTRRKTEKARNCDPSALVAIHNIFVIGKAKPLQRLHQSELPPPPDTWNQLKNHQYSKEFWDAMSVEYNTLSEKNTIKPVQQTNSMNPIPLRWVFTYKVDEAGYLLKFKARICVRGDLQPETDEDNYASTLAFQVFRVLMAIVAYFDLETLQVDAVNAFCNSPLDDEIYLYNPPGFGRKGQILRLLRGL